MNSTTTFSSSKSTLDDTQQRTVVNSKKPITRVIYQESYAQETVFYTRTIYLSMLFTLI